MNDNLTRINNNATMSLGLGTSHGAINNTISGHHENHSHEPITRV